MKNLLNYLTESLIGKVGDTLTHQKFGEGVVTKLLGNNILEVVFSDNNKKELLGSHYTVSRK